jgi:hypothetical protein
MPTSPWSMLLVLISLAAGGPAVAPAQEGLTPQPGERVQARIVAPRCDDGEWEVALLTIAGTGAGAVIGALVGAALPAGPQWLIGTTRRPARIGRLEVHPAVRVSFR